MLLMAEAPYQASLLVSMILDDRNLLPGDPYDYLGILKIPKVQQAGILRRRQELWNL